MFDFSFGEILLIAVIALVVLGPERLPKVARAAGQLVGRLQRMVSSVKSELSVQLEMEELKKAKSELESAANQFREEMHNVRNGLQHGMNDFSSGDDIPAWEKLPEQRTPADFGVDEYGKPLNHHYDQNTRYTGSFERNDYGYGFQTASLRQQALRRKRDIRPRYRPKPHLRVRKR